MRVTVVTPPDPIVTWEEADAHLRLDGNDALLPYVEGLIAVATAHLDGPDGWLGRALGVQTLEMRIDDFGDVIRLPYPPFAAIESVEIVGPGGSTALDPPAYVAVDGLLFPASAGWPALPSPWGGPRVRIRWTAGYEEVPAPIRHAVLVMVADMFRFTESVDTASLSKVDIPATVERLLMPFRVWR